MSSAFSSLLVGSAQVDTSAAVLCCLQLKNCTNRVANLYLVILSAAVLQPSLLATGTVTQIYCHDQTCGPFSQPPDPGRTWCSRSSSSLVADKKGFCSRSSNKSAWRLSLDCRWRFWNVNFASSELLAYCNSEVILWSISEFVSRFQQIFNKHTDHYMSC